MREPGNGLAQDQDAWARLYRKTLEIINAKMDEKRLGSIKSIM